jgi:hypothetical protein
MFDVEQKARNIADAMAWKEIGVSSRIVGIESIELALEALAKVWRQDGW